LCLLIGYDEFNFVGERSRKLEELRFTQLVMSSESGHGPKRGAAVNAEVIRLYK
jgi:hypothetical protein